MPYHEWQKTMFLENLEIRKLWQAQYPSCSLFVKDSLHFPYPSYQLSLPTVDINYFMGKSVASYSQLLLKRISLLPWVGHVTFWHFFVKTFCSYQLMVVMNDIKICLGIRFLTIRYQRLTANLGNLNGKLKWLDDKNAQ